MIAELLFIALSCSTEAGPSFIRQCKYIVYAIYPKKRKFISLSIVKVYREPSELVQNNHAESDKKNIVYIYTPRLIY